MRTKLSDILSTIDQYNGMGEYSDRYKVGDGIDIRTNLPEAPDHATISENLIGTIKNMLNENSVREDRSTSPLDHPDSYVLSFEKFINEQKGTPLNVQSYFGNLDDEEDFEEE